MGATQPIEGVAGARDREQIASRRVSGMTLLADAIADFWGSLELEAEQAIKDSGGFRGAVRERENDAAGSIG